MLVLLAALLLQTSAPDTVGPTSASLPLFASHEILEVTLRADLRTLFRDRDSTRRKEHQATITVLDGSGAEKRLPLTLRTRGHYRRQTSTCTTPPIRMRLRGRAASGTPFEGQRRLKLVVQCRDRAEYEQFLLKEYLVYRTFQLFTDRAFRARLLRVTWEDEVGRSAPVTQYAFLVESEEELSNRLGARVLEQKGAADEDLDQHQGALVDVFQFFIGNTDWSIRGLHNIVLFWYEDQRLPYPVPYDFDWSGVVEARYAQPDARLPIKTVRTRLWRGRCRSADDLQPTLAMFRERREAIYELWRSAPGLDDRTRRRTLDYFDEFYRTIEDRGALRRELNVECRP